MSHNLFYLSPQENVPDWEDLYSILLKHTVSEYEFKNNFTKPENVNQSQQIIDETNRMIKLLKDKENISFSYFQQNIIQSLNFNILLKLIKKSAFISIEETNQIILILEYIVYIADTELILFNNKFHESLVSKIKLIERIVKDSRLFIISSGVLDYSQHPAIKELNSELISIRDHARKKLHNYKTDKKEIEYFDFDETNNEYFVAIKSENYSHKMGKFINLQRNNNQVYFSPDFLTNINQSIKEKISQINKIIRELHSNLLSKFYENYQTLLDAKNAFSFFNNYITRSLFSLELDLKQPTISENLNIKATNLYHPLIQNPIKNDFEFADFKGMLISGPNTGGKSVFLKSIALNVFLANMGLNVSAEDAYFPFLDNIILLDHDYENLSQGFSSFSGEVNNLMKVLNQLTETSQTFIFVDEIFNTTGSEEASALAYAILLNAIKNSPQTRFFLTSHHQFLKTLIHQNSDFLSSHMMFDGETNTPIFKISIGAPGSSMAINTFKRISNSYQNSHEISTHAERLLSNKEVQYEKLLENLQLKEHHLDKVLKHNRQLNNELASQKQSMEGLYKIKLREKLNQAEEKIKILQSTAYNELKQIKRIKKDISLETLTSANSSFKQISSAQGKLQEEFETSSQEKNNGRFINQSLTREELEVGKWYFSTRYNQKIKLSSVSNKAIFGFLGKLKVSCQIDELKPTSQAGGHHAPKKQSSWIRTKEAHTEYNFIGKRLEDLERELPNLFDLVRTDHLPFLIIIHGHGKGVLKKFIRDQIKLDKDLTIDQDETGNDGQTRIIKCPESKS